MNANHIRHNVPNGFAKGFKVNESNGFCICPTCSHLVFDETLTGMCPCCHRRFSPALRLEKYSGRKHH